MLAFPLRSRTRQGCTLSPLLFYTVLKVLVSSFRPEKESHPNQKGRSETVFKHNEMVYVNGFYKINRISEFSKVSEFKFNTQSQLHLLTLAVNSQKLI